MILKIRTELGTQNTEMGKYTSCKLSFPYVGTFPSGVRQLRRNHASETHVHSALCRTDFCGNTIPLWNENKIDGNMLMKCLFESPTPGCVRQLSCRLLSVGPCGVPLREPGHQLRPLSPYSLPLRSLHAVGPLARFLQYIHVLYSRESWSHGRWIHY